MTRYEERFGTDWQALSRDEATARAYAIGVAEKLGEENREELEAIYHEMDTAYNKSMVELAYQEGRREASRAVKGSNGAAAGDVWDDLVVGEFEPPESEEPLTGGRDKLPAALDISDLLEKFDADASATDRPEFLDR